MATVPTGGGNPNVFTTFKGGRYELVPASGQSISNNVVMLTVVNDVQILGDISLTAYSAGQAFATLSAECRPHMLTKVPVCVTDNVNQPAEKVVTLNVDETGSMWLESSYESATVHLLGVDINISGNFYKEVRQ